MIESSVLNIYSDICLTGGSMVLFSPNRWSFKSYLTVTQSPSLPLYVSFASVSSLDAMQSIDDVVRLLRLVQVSSSLNRTPLIFLAENETKKHQTPSPFFSRWFFFRSDLIGGGTGTPPKNPNALTLLMGLSGPLVYDYWVGIKTAWAMKLGFFWVYFIGSCWKGLLESAITFGGMIIFGASLVYLMHLHCSSLTFIVLTSLLFIRFTVKESPIITPLSKRAIFPGWCFTDQRLISHLENLQTAYKRALSGLLKAALSWSNPKNVRSLTSRVWTP